MYLEFNIYEKKIYELFLDNIKFILYKLWKIDIDEIDEIINEIIKKNILEDNRKIFYGYNAITKDYFISLNINNNNIEEMKYCDSYQSKITLLQTAITSIITIHRISTVIT